MRRVGGFSKRKGKRKNVGIIFFEYLRVFVIELINVVFFFLFIYFIYLYMGSKNIYKSEKHEVHWSKQLITKCFINQQ